MKHLAIKFITFILISHIQSPTIHGSATNETKDLQFVNNIPNLISRTGGAPTSTTTTTTQASVDSSTESVLSSYLPRERSDTNIDQNAQSSTASVSQNHPNHLYHHNYLQQHPNHKNYPLDPYPSASYTSLVTLSNSNTSHQLKDFLNRDHHQSSSIGQVNDNVGGGTTNSYGHPVPTTNSGSGDNRNSEQPTAVSYNHKFNVQDSVNSPLNTGLIQNLTASLFPIKQLSNATLFSLSELLNRTRQSSGYFPSNHNFGGYSQHQHLSSPPVSGHYNQINPRIYEPQYSILDYLRPNQYLETGSQRYPNHAPMSLFFDPPTMQQNYGGLTATSSGPTLTYPNHHGAASPAFQYVQHHDTNNHQHIDEILYHSTPFRPSIVNPPSLGSQSTKFQPSSYIQPAGVIRSAGVLSRHKEPETGGLGNNLNSFASLISQTNSISDIRSEFPHSSGQSTYNNNGNSTKISIFSRLPGFNEAQTTTTASPPLDDFNFDARFNMTNTPVTTLNSTDQDAPNGANKSSGSNPSTLFDLYEREIDNQIREALYASTEHPLLAASRSRPMSNQWFERTPPSSLLTSDDSNDHQFLSSASWDRPVALGSQTTKYLPHRPGSTQLTSADHLAAALQELPTFGASDLQPIFPTGPTYSLLPHSNHHQDNAYPSDSHSMASIASQLYSVVPPTASALTTLLDTESITNKPNSNRHNHHTNQQSSGSSSNHHGSTTSYTGLPAILLKLNSNALSSILTTPLAQLYASIPKNRNQKKPSNGNIYGNHHHNTNHHHQPNHNMPQQSTQLSQYISPSSLFPLHSLGGLTGKSLFGATGTGSAGASSMNLATLANGQNSNYRKSKHQSSTGASTSQHQFQRAAIVAATANLLAATAATAAAEGHQLSPLQAALIQAQAINNIGAYLNSNQEYEPSGSSNHDYHHLRPGTNSASGTAYESSSGRTGGVGQFISPLIWRNFLSPAHWARKQSITSHSSQIPIHQQVTSSLLPSSLIPSFTLYGSHHKSNNNNNNSNDNQSNNIIQQNANTNNNNGRHHRLSSLFGSGSLAAHLVNPISSASSNSVQFATSGATSGTSSATTSTVASYFHPQTPKKPKLEIRILKIPVAFFDHPSATNSSGATIGLLPAPSNLAASILGHIPCTLSHGGATLQPHNLDQHIVSASMGAATLGTTMPYSAAPLRNSSSR